MRTSVPEGRDTRAIQNQAILGFIVLIGASGALMMTVTSSPTAKGASFLWLPAALQLMAGIWLGPWRGAIAAGLGAYLAGILAYGGWGLVDIIMNPIAGGFANAFLPALFFSAFRIDPTFGVETNEEGHVLKALGRLAILLSLVIGVSFGLRPIGLGAWGYLPPLLILLAAPLVLRGLALKTRDLTIAFLICVFISFVSAVIGVAGQVVGGQAWQAAAIGTGLGWFLGDTVSAVLGLYVLAAFTSRAREAGLSRN
jgi:uncharacterized membrane protein